MTDYRDRWVTIDCEIIAETDLAYRIDVGEEEYIWVPKSVCGEPDNYSLSIKQWFAREKGLI